MTLSAARRRYLRQLAHNRKPTVLIGDAGLSGAVRAAVEEALDHHELIKVRIRNENRDAIVAALAEDFNAVLVQRLGHVATLYRPHPEKPRIELS